MDPLTLGALVAVLTIAVLFSGISVAAGLLVVFGFIRRRKLKARRGRKQENRKNPGRKLRKRVKRKKQRSFLKL